MPSGFDALPEPLRAVAKPRVYQQHIHPAVPPPEPLVDCGVYVDGHRLPGRYDSYAAALNKVREIELEDMSRRHAGGVRLGRAARTRPGPHAGGRRRLRAAPVGGRGRRARPSAAQAGALRRHAVSGAEDRQLRAARIGGAGPRDRRNRRGHGLRREQLRGHRAPRRTRRTDRRAQADGRQPRAFAVGPVRGDARDRRPRGGPLPRSDQPDGNRHRRHRGGRVRARGASSMSNRFTCSSAKSSNCAGA